MVESESPQKRGTLWFKWPTLFPRDAEPLNGSGKSYFPTIVIMRPIMKKNEPISRIMSRNVLTLTHGDPISKIRRIFTESGVSHLPVVNNGNLVGIVSWTDLMRISFGDAFGESTAAVDATLDHTITLESLMQPDPVTLDHTATIRDAAHILAKADFHSIPIVDGQHLVGIVTSTDLISHLIDMI